MPKMTRSADEVGAVRDQILEMAFKIIKKSGYEGLKMGRIASKVRMTAPNLYNYFSSKDELLIAIHKKAYIMLHDKLRHAVIAADTPQEKFKNMIYAFVEFGTQNSNLYDIMFNRPVKQHRDYIGTPLEALSNDEFRNSQRVLSFAFKTMQDYWKTKQNAQSVDLRRMGNHTIITLHGIISLYNSRDLFYIVNESEMSMNELIDDAMSPIIK